MSDIVIWPGEQSFDSPEETECAICNQLYEVFLLLGGKKEFADLIKRIPDRNLTKEDFLKLNQYAIDQFASVKSRLAYLNTIKIKPQGNDL